MMHKSIIIALILLLSLASCGGSSSETEDVVEGWYKPTRSATWNWQLNGTLDMDVDADIYIVDLFDTNRSTIVKLHASGKKVIAYFSAGSYESWREDAGDFPAEILGEKMDGWDERWLDIRSTRLRTIMIERIVLAKEKGFDGVEADNVDGYTNHSGFDLTAKDQEHYNLFLATEAHKNNLAIALKNDLDQIAILEPYFDFAINEQCHEFDECEKVLPFIAANKPVFNAEYHDSEMEAICADSSAKGISTLFLPLALDGSFRKVCP